MWGRKNRIRMAKEAILHSGVQSFQARRKKKGVARAAWHIQINAAVRPFGTNYSKFMDALKKANITLNRKMLAELGINHPDVFAAIVKKVVVPTEPKAPKAAKAPKAKKVAKAKA